MRFTILGENLLGQIQAFISCSVIGVRLRAAGGLFAGKFTASTLEQFSDAANAMRDMEGVVIFRESLECCRNSLM